MEYLLNPHDLYEVAGLLTFACGKRSFYVKHS